MFEGDARRRENTDPVDELAKGRRVCWIDDEITHGCAEVRCLTEAGFYVVCAQSADAALTVLEQESFDAMLLDLNMPGSSGMDLLGDLATRKNRTPVVVLTGYGTMERAVGAMKLGAVDVLAKPIDIDVLAARLIEVRARYPDGADPPSITEAEWVRLQCERMAECVNRPDAIRMVVRLLTCERVTLRYFTGCAGALQLLLTNNEPSFAVLRSQAILSIRAGSSAPWPTDRKLLTALALLEKRPRKQSQVMFAERSGISRAYLSRRLHQQTNRPPSDWCRAAVLREALRQLVVSSEDIGQIAYSLGYDHVSQFNREFKKTFGSAPRQLRRCLEDHRLSGPIDHPAPSAELL